MGPQHLGFGLLFTTVSLIAACGVTITGEPVEGLKERRVQYARDDHNAGVRYVTPADLQKCKPPPPDIFGNASIMTGPARANPKLGCVHNFNADLNILHGRNPEVWVVYFSAPAKSNDPKRPEKINHIYCRYEVHRKTKQVRLVDTGTDFSRIGSYAATPQDVAAACNVRIIRKRR